MLIRGSGLLILGMTSPWSPKSSKNYHKWFQVRDIFGASTTFKMKICPIPFNDEIEVQDIPGGNRSLGTLSASLQMVCFPIAAMETKKSSRAGESSWPWTGSGTEDIPTSKCSFRPGGKNRQELTPLLEVCWSRVVLRRGYAPFLRGAPDSCGQLVMT